MTQEFGYPSWVQALVLAAFILLSPPILGQETPCIPFGSGKSEKALGKAQNKEKHDLTERIEMLRKAAEDDPECAACQAELARLLFSQFKRTGVGAQEARQTAENLLLDCPDFDREMGYIAGALAYADRDWSNAYDHFQGFLDRLPASPSRSMERMAEEVREVLPVIAFERAFWANEDAFVPEVVAGINTAADEFLPALSPDGSLMFFTRRSSHKAKGDVLSREVEVFEMASRMDDPIAFDASSPLSDPFNTGAQYGGASISVDNRELWIAASNPTPGNPNNVDLFVTTYEVVELPSGEPPVYTWGPLEPVDALNTEDGWEAQPALSADGQTLLFARIDGSTTPDESGNPTMDLMESRRQTDGTWSAPSPLPQPINSAANDKAPFLHPDGQTLFFASDRQPGGGGYDLWSAKRSPEGGWSAPMNIGAPVNTAQDEHGMVVDIDGKTAYFAGRRAGTKGLDVMAFPLPEAVQPEPVLLIKGALLTPEGLPAKGAKVTLEIMGEDVTRRELLVREDDGRFAAVVAKPSANEHLVLTTEGENIAFDAMDIATDSPAIEANLQARPLQLDEPLEIRNIEFPVDGDALDASGRRLLASFAGYLNRHAEFHVRLEGHTDNTGDESRNIALSQSRADAVRHFLIKQGVDELRLTATGLGSARPLADNATSEGRSANRRTEFTIFAP